MDGGKLGFYGELNFSCRLATGEMDRSAGHYLPVYPTYFVLASVSKLDRNPLAVVPQFG
jgi:hypothetical protein